MDKDIIETAIFLSSALFLFYKAKKKHKPPSLFAGIILLILSLSKWPLFLPMKLCLGLMAFSSAAFILYEKIRRKSLHLWYFHVIILVGVGLVFVLEAL